MMVQAVRAWAEGLVSTAFVAYDMPYYLANARQHFIDGIQLTYGNPYAPYGSPAIYFQPQLLVLGILQGMGLSPDAALVVFGMGTTAFAAIAAAKLYQEWIGWHTPAQKLGFVCFFWGGGLLALGGALFGLFGHLPFFQSLFLFDPVQGWWMFNFGRNLAYPTEALYHGIFLLAITALVQKRFHVTLLWAALLSACHPFTGISLALILVAYAALELILKSDAASWRLLAGASAITVLHVGYYVAFLNRFADHRAMQEQWELDWPYMFWSIVPALYLVGILAFGRLTRWKNLKPFLAQANFRLGLVWFAVILGLTQHDLVIQPRQPIHFAHGYDWMALFLLAAPGLFSVFEKLFAIRPPPLRAVAVIAFVAVFLSDNLLWFVSFSDASVQKNGIVLTRDEKDILTWLDEHAAIPAYVTSSDRWISYLTPTYTRVRSWNGHEANTPHAKQRFAEAGETFSAGTPLPTHNPVYYVPENNLHWTPPAGTRQMYANGTFTVWFSEASGK